MKTTVLIIALPLQKPTLGACVVGTAMIKYYSIHFIGTTLLFTSAVAINSHKSNIIQNNRILPTWDNTTSKAITSKQITVRVF